MEESQNTEWKESWRDEYLKWICGFANAQGGRIYIGKRDDGTVVGVSDSKKLLEEIPNKIQTTMGIVADVNLLSENGREYIEIVVGPSSYPVNYKGEYHYRSGSTKQQLRGNALTQFIQGKVGLPWDSVPVDYIKAEELDLSSFEIFRREAIRKKRMERADLDIPNEELLEHLDLMVDGKLKRAAVMLFHKKPGKIVTGCYVKIGKFGEGADLQYQDLLEGSLFSMADRVIDLIYTKYLKAAITYEHDVRVETYPFPREGVREAIYNALGHNNYARCIPIQIRIEDDAMYVSNSCVLPQDWTAETLMKPHKSVPFNPAIANVFYRAGYIEAWGRGIQKICEACRAHGAPDPEYMILGEDITVKFTALQTAKVDVSQEKSGDPETKPGDSEPEVQTPTVASDPKIMEKIRAGFANSKWRRPTRDKVEQFCHSIKLDQAFGTSDIAQATKASLPVARRILKMLSEFGAVKKINGNGKGRYIFERNNPIMGDSR